MCLDDRIIIPCEAFLASLERKGYRPATLAAWRRSLHRFFRYAQTEGVTDAWRVPLDVLLSYECTATQQGRTPAAIKDDIKHVFALTRWFVSKGAR